MRIVVSVLLFFLVSASSHAGDSLFEGENLLTPFETPASEWEQFQKKTQYSYSLLWQRKGVGFNDSYSVTIHHDKITSLAEIRNIQDDPGRKHCDKFDSSILTEAPVGPYASVTWITACEISGQATSRILHKAIRGKDSLYDIQKIWRIAVDEKTIQIWKDRLASVSVCDTRGAVAPCPTTLEKVK